MKALLFAFIVGLMVGCASSKVNVDLDSCSERGKIDGIRIGECEKVKVVK